MQGVIKDDKDGKAYIKLVSLSVGPLGAQDIEVL